MWWWQATRPGPSGRLRANSRTMLTQRLQANMAAVANNSPRCNGGESQARRAAAATAQVVDPVGSSDWGALLAGFSNYSFFHSAAWARALEGAYGYTPVYLTLEEAGTVRSLLPL